MKALPHLARPLLVPALILAAAALAFVPGVRLPPTLAGLRDLGPYLVLVAGAAVSLWFNRGGAFIAAVSLLAAYAGYDFARGLGAQEFPARAVFASIAILVPANMLLALLLPERGITHQHDYRWLMLAAIEVLLVAWIASAGRTPLFSGASWQSLFEHWMLRGPHAPWLGRFVFGAAFAVALWRTLPRGTLAPAPINAGKAGALLGFFIACEALAAPGVFPAFVAASGAILFVAVLQESHRLAFRDELTGLPGRRALQEKLASLGPVFAIAMIDIDHFKKFNDTHGHHIGDQVLKLVAARLAEVGGGGKAFRYGGEEFTVLFADRPSSEVLAHLEQLRAGIESYRMMLRSGNRPKNKDEGARRRGAGAQDGSLSVTVSIGLAGPDRRHAAPAEVLKAADRALYRAKQAGRNRVMS